MSKEQIADVCVIGSGVVGCAVAWALAKSAHKVVVIESASRQGTGITSRNSEVIHSGLYYPHGSLKAKLCVEGRHLLYEHASRYDLNAKKIGKLVIANSDAENASLEQMLTHAEGNGVANLKLLSGAEVQELEPHVTAKSALHCPESGIISAHEVCDSYLLQAQRKGCQFAFLTKLESINYDGSHWNLSTSSVQESGALYRFKVKYVVNCGGLYADEIAAMAGVDIKAAGYEQHWVKGTYFSLSSHWGKKLRHLVYPLPEKNARGLGVHVTIDLGSQVKLGPDVEEIARVEDYKVDPTKREAFFLSAKRFLPELKEEELTPMMAGIRPKLTRPGEAQRDFIIAEESSRGLPGLVNLLGIESPGLTASLAIGNHVAEIINKVR